MEASFWDVLWNNTKQVVNSGHCIHFEHADFSPFGIAVVVSTYQCHSCILESKEGGGDFLADVELDA